MFDSLFNILIVLIPLAIFIGRSVSRARARQTSPPPPPRIPVHFEDDDDYEYEFYAHKAGETKPPKPASRPLPSKAAPVFESPFVGKDDFNRVTEASRTLRQMKTTGGSIPASASEKKGFPHNLNHLSPLKQAVVMAEILGPPKGA